MDLLKPYDGITYLFEIKQTDWDKIYKNQMDKVRPFIKGHSEELLNRINDRLEQDLWDKYCRGNISSWEMDSISCYIHDHELKKVPIGRYGFTSYAALPDNPIVNYEFTSKQTGQKIPLFKISRIIGTVLDRDKGKKTVNILTPEGDVVPVKIFGDAFTHYDKQISEKGADGKKHVVEKSWFSRGNKIIVTGIKREESFIGKKYKNTPYHLVELITRVSETGAIETQKERVEE
jgi:DNA polymerase-3 subunit alpha